MRYSGIGKACTDCHGGGIGGLAEGDREPSGVRSSARADVAAVRAPAGDRRRRPPAAPEPARRPRRRLRHLPHRRRLVAAAQAAPLRPPGHRVPAGRRARPGRLPRLPSEPGLLPGRRPPAPTATATRTAARWARSATPATRRSRGPTGARRSASTTRTRFPLLGRARRPRLRGLPPRPAAAGVHAATPPSACRLPPARLPDRATNPDHERLRLLARVRGAATRRRRGPGRAGRSARGFAHPATFPLTGAHTPRVLLRMPRQRRSRARRGSAWPATATTTTAPRTPTTARRGFSTTCQNCHTDRAWPRATFDHDLSRFPLTGAHAGVECARCHVGGRFAGTPTECVSCHQDDYNRAQPEPPRVGVPDRVPDLPPHERVAAGDLRPQPLLPARPGDHGGIACASCHPNPGELPRLLVHDLVPRARARGRWHDERRRRRGLPLRERRLPALPSGGPRMSARAWRSLALSLAARRARRADRARAPARSPSPTGRRRRSTSPADAPPASPSATGWTSSPARQTVAELEVAFLAEHSASCRDRRARRGRSSPATAWCGSAPPRAASPPPSPPPRRAPAAPAPVARAVVRPATPPAARNATARADRRGVRSAIRRF